MEGLWFTEKQTPGVAISCLINRILHSEKTPYQELKILETKSFGRMLTLDGVIQTTVEDEFVYHEMITHVALNTHPNPRRALVIGGGDGGSIREIIKHQSIKKATLVEIDERVVINAKKYLPEISTTLDDSRVEVRIEDGIKHIQDHKQEYDLIVVDSTDPVGPAVGLFSREFYTSIFEALTEDGIFVAQTESPFFNRELMIRIKKDVADIYPICRVYTAFVPTYPGGLWSFTMGSKKYDPLEVNQQDIPDLNTRYYTPEIHRASFVLPQFVKDFLEEEA